VVFSEEEKEEEGDPSSSGDYSDED